MEAAMIKPKLLGKLTLACCDLMDEIFCLGAELEIADSGHTIEVLLQREIISSDTAMTIGEILMLEQNLIYSSRNEILTSVIRQALAEAQRIRLLLRSKSQ